MNCPWCAEPLPALRRTADCPHCGRTLRSDAGERLRPLDLDYDRVLREADASSLLWTKRGALVALVLAALSLVPVAGAALAYALLVLAQFLWAGIFVARPYHRHFSPLRRMVSRWVRRLAMVLVVVPLHAAVFAPFVGLVAAPAVFFGVCWAVRAYARFHLAREKERLPVTAAEKLLVAALALAMLGGACLFGVLVYVGAVALDWFGG